MKFWKKMSSWNESFVDLIDHRLTTLHQVHGALSNIYTYMTSKCCNRNISKKIYNPYEQSTMFKKFFNVYLSNAPPSKICQTKIMRKLIKHNGDNDRNLSYIYPRLVKIEMNTWNMVNEAIKHDLTVKAWVRDFLATTLDPSLTLQQSYFYRQIPIGYHELLLSHKKYIIDRIKEAIINDWLTKKDVEAIIANLETEPFIVIDSPPPFKKETIVAFITYYYQFSINEAGLHRNIFKKIYSIGLHILAQSDQIPSSLAYDTDVKTEIDTWIN